VELILKLVAGLVAGLREYFLIVAGLVAIPSIVLLAVFVVGLIRPSRSKPAAEKNS
jgi:ABC-type antimicrobial peptide transport system permease subunit